MLSRCLWNGRVILDPADWIISAHDDPFWWFVVVASSPPASVSVFLVSWDKSIDESFSAHLALA